MFDPPGTYQHGRMQIASLGVPSTLTQGTEMKSHSTLHRVSFADIATATATAALPHAHSKTGQTLPSEPKSSPAASSRGGLLTMRKAALERKRSGCRGCNKGVPKVKQIHHSPSEELRLSSVH